MNESPVNELEQLSTLCQELKIEISDPAILEQVDNYRKLLWDTNERINLTRHTTIDSFVKRDLLDSYQLSLLLKPNEEVIDFGTGGGVPGVLVAILRPDLDMSVCDNVGKKAAAVGDMIDKLGLNIPVYPTQIQKILGDATFDSLIARAVGPLHRICTWLSPHWHCFSRLLAIKGPAWVDERGEARHLGSLNNIELRKVASYPMPDTHSESVILQLNRAR